MAESTSPAETVNLDNSGSTSMCCCGLLRRSNYNAAENETSPDADFHADSLIKLTHGVTAYRIVEPRESSKPPDALPIIVCLHGLQNSSYMWADIADLLSDFEQGPQARVLVFDFYGRGRSPWTGVNITLDTLVTQTKELMDCKYAFMQLSSLFYLFFFMAIMIYPAYHVFSTPPSQLFHLYYCCFSKT